MRYWTRKSGSQRNSAPLQIQFEPNFAGDGGWNCMSFLDERGVYHMIKPENDADVRELQSQAAILAHHVKEQKNG